MRFNQFSYYPVSTQESLDELAQLGFKLNPADSPKQQFESFIRTCFFNYQNTDYPLSTLAVDEKTDLLNFFNSDQELTADIFYTVAFQLLGFSYLVDLTMFKPFVKKLDFLLNLENL